MRNKWLRMKGWLPRNVYRVSHVSNLHTQIMAKPKKVKTLLPPRVVSSDKCRLSTCAKFAASPASLKVLHQQLVLGVIFVAASRVQCLQHVRCPELSRRSHRCNVFEAPLLLQ